MKAKNNQTFLKQEDQEFCSITSDTTCPNEPNMIIKENNNSGSDIENKTISSDIYDSKNYLYHHSLIKSGNYSLHHTRKNQPVIKTNTLILPKFREAVVAAIDDNEIVEFLTAFRGGWLALCLIGEHTLLSGASSRNRKKAKRFRTLDASVRWLQATGAKEITVKLNFDTGRNWL